MTRVKKKSPHLLVTQGRHEPVTAPASSAQIEQDTLETHPPAAGTAAVEPTHQGACPPPTKPAQPNMDNVLLRVYRPGERVMKLLEGMAGAPCIEAYLQSIILRGHAADALRLVRFLQPSDTDNSLNLDMWTGILLAVQGRYEEVEEALARLGPATWSKYFEAAQRVGHVDMVANRWLCQQALLREPHAAVAWRHLAATHLAMQDGEAALQAVARLGELEPLEDAELALRIEAHTRLGRWEDARADLTKLLQSRRHTSDLCAIMAAIEAEAGDFSAARALCAGIAPRTMCTQSGVRYLIHAACLMGDLAILQACEAHIVHARYCEPEGFAKLVDNYAQRGELKAAWKMARYATLVMPQQASSYRMLGEILDAMGRAAEAAKAYAQAIAQGTPNITLALAHAEALLASGQNKEAEGAFCTLLAQTPTLLPALRGVVAALAAREAPAGEQIDWLWCLHQQQPHDIAVAHALIKAAMASPGRAYRRRAQQLLERLHTEHPDDASWSLLLARTLRNTDPARASALAMHTLAIQPDNVEAQQIRDASQAAIQVAQQKHAYLLRPVPLPATAASTSDQASAAVGPTQALPTPVSFMLSGQAVSGIEVGKNHENRMVVRTREGDCVWAPWSVCSAIVPMGAVAGLTHGLAFAVPTGIVARFDAILATPVAGTATVLDFCRVLGKRSEALLCGGAVRDIIADPHHAEPRDIDLVTTLAPSLVRLSCNSLPGQTPGLEGRPAGVVSPYTTEFFGLVKYGTVQNGEVRAHLDVMSMRAWGALEPVQLIKGAHKPVKPIAFGADLYADALFRDFTCNALYYDPQTRTLFDPTGQGKIDATQKRLQLCSAEHIRKNETLGWRYIKMRQLGYSTTERTRLAIRTHFAHYMQQPDADAWLQRSWARAFAPEGDAAAYARQVEAARAILEQDDLGPTEMVETLLRG